MNKLLDDMKAKLTPEEYHMVEVYDKVMHLVFRHLDVDRIGQMIKNENSIPEGFVMVGNSLSAYNDYVSQINEYYKYRRDLLREPLPLATQNDFDAVKELFQYDDFTKGVRIIK